MLGDRIRRTRSAGYDNTYFRSLSSRGHVGGLSETATDLVAVLSLFEFRRVIIETVGAGQADIEIHATADCTVVMTVPGLGDGVQASKAGLMEIGDIFAVNKADMPGADDAAGMIERALAVAYMGEPGVNSRREKKAPASATYSVTPAVTQGLRRCGGAHGHAGEDESTWVPPVRKIVATENRGVAELAQAVDEFIAWSDRTGRRRAHRRERAYAQVDARALGAAAGALSRARPARTSCRRSSRPSSTASPRATRARSRSRAHCCAETHNRRRQRMLRQIARLLVGFLLLFTMEAPASAQGPEAVTINSNLTVRHRPFSPVLFVIARGSVILLAGGNGVLDLIQTGGQAGDIRDLQGNFLIRSARRFLNARYNVAMLDAAPAFPDPDGLNNQRLTQAHADHIGAVIGVVRARWPNKPVWLVGTSNGTLSAVNAAARLTGANLPTGIVLTSAITASSTSPDETGTVLAANPGLANISDIDAGGMARTGSMRSQLQRLGSICLQRPHRAAGSEEGKFRCQPEDYQISPCPDAARSTATASTASSSPCSPPSWGSWRRTSAWCRRYNDTGVPMKSRLPSSIPQWRKMS